MKIEKDLLDMSIICQDDKSIKAYNNLSIANANAIAMNLIEQKSDFDFVLKEMGKNNVNACEMGTGIVLEDNETIFILKFTIYTKKKNPPIINVTYFNQVSTDEYLDFMNEANDRRNGYKKIK